MSNLAEAQKTEMEAFEEYYANTPAAKKWQALGEMYKQMPDVPKNIELKWNAFHEAAKAKRPMSLIKSKTTYFAGK